MISYFKQFIECHEGMINRLAHVLGFSLMIFGVIYKNLLVFLIGGIFQEAGHFYQYSKTKDERHSPLFCLKPQLIFFYPLFFLAIACILLAK